MASKEINYKEQSRMVAFCRYTVVLHVYWFEKLFHNNMVQKEKTVTFKEVTYNSSCHVSLVQVFTFNDRFDNLFFLSPMSTFRLQNNIIKVYASMVRKKK